MKKSLTLLVLPLLLAGGCADDNSPVDAQPSLEDLLIANCYALRDSVEAYASQNGEYPDYPFWRPYFNNPFTGNLTQPVHSFALNPGETGYVPYYAAQKYEGYLITGFGETNQIISLKKNYPDSVLALERLVLANCYTVQTAAEAFAAENNGVYPANISVDITPLGNTLVDFLPGGGLLENPFTQVGTEPVNSAAAANPGETAYVAAIDSVFISGYDITGFGARFLIILIRKYPGYQF